MDTLIGYSLGHVVTITTDFAPKVEHYNSFWNPISTTVDKNFIHCNLILSTRGSLRLTDLYVPIVELFWFRDFDRSCILFRYASLWLLERELALILVR